MNETDEEYGNSREAKKPAIGCRVGMGTSRSEGHAPCLRRIRRGWTISGTTRQKEICQSIRQAYTAPRAGRQRHSGQAPPTVAWRRCIETYKRTRGPIHERSQTAFAHATIANHIGDAGSYSWNKSLVRGSQTRSQTMAKFATYQS